MDRTSIEAGQPAFILTVFGGSLTPASQVEWNSSPRSTIFVSSSELTAQILASDIQNPGMAEVSIFTPSPGGGISQSLTFTITPAPTPIPQVTKLSPSGVFAGSGLFTLNVTGTNFVSGSVVTANGASLSTAYENSTLLEAEVPASVIATGGTVQIAVLNPQPGGGSSNLFALSVTNPIPSVSSVSPAAVQAGSAATVVTVNGSQFVSNSVVLLNGAPCMGGPCTGSFVSAAEMSISLSAAALAQGGVNQIQVQSPAPGGGTSAVVPLPVDPTDEAGLPVLVDLAPDGSQANEGVCGATCSGVPTLTTAGPSVSTTGEFVAYASISTNLLASPTTGTSDILVRDTCLSTAGTSTSTSCTPKTTRIDIAADGSAADGPSSQPSLDSAADHLAYTSTASNLTNYLTEPIPTGTRQVYWQATCISGTTSTGTCSSGSGAPVLVSIDPSGNPGDGDSYDPVISSDGRYVAFTSLATKLVAGITMDGKTPQVFVRDTCNVVPPATSSTACTPTTYLVSISSDGTTFGDHASGHAAISNTGLYVAFSSAATNLDAAAPNPTALQEVYVTSTCITAVAGCVPTITLVSTPDGTTLADSASVEPTISFDGRFVAFGSTATNLGISAGGNQQIYVQDTCAGVSTGCTPFSLTLVSSPDTTATPITPANANSNNPSFSQCGTTVATTTSPTTCTVGQFISFSTKASNLGSTINGVENVFVRNTCVGVTTTTTTSGITVTCAPYTFLGSQPAGGGSANGDSIVPAISADGRTVGFLSSASNLVANDANSLADVFLASAAPSFTVTVALEGTGSGTVTDSLSKISCTLTAATTTTSATVSGVCSAKYLYGDSVTLTASPTSPSLFVSWGGSVTSTQCPSPTTPSSSSSSCSVTVTNNTFSNITATFNK